MFRTRSLPLALCTCLALLIGCDSGPDDTPELAEVSGVVTLDGKPIEGASVRFTPSAGGRPSEATTDAEGKYTLIYSTTATGAAVGEHDVTVSGNELMNDDGTMPAASKIPPKYSKEPQKKTVEAGDNTIDLKLSSM